jgi:large subunit ribosomal protein L25
MDSVKFEVELRKEFGKNKVKKLKREGVIPGTVYGKDMEPISITVKPKDLLRLYKGKFGKNTIIDLTVNNEGKAETVKVISYEFEVDHIKQTLEHISFIKVNEKVLLTIEVPVSLKGTAPGVKLGGNFYQKFNYLRLNCLPQDIPENIEIDISSLEIGDGIHIKDLPNNPKFEVLNDKREVIVQITAQKVKSADDEADEAAAAAAASAGTEGEESADKAESKDASTSAETTK